MKITFYTQKIPQLSSLVNRETQTGSVFTQRESFCSSHLSKRTNALTRPQLRSIYDQMHKKLPAVCRAFHGCRVTRRPALKSASSSPARPESDGGTGPSACSHNACRTAWCRRDCSPDKEQKAFLLKYSLKIFAQISDWNLHVYIKTFQQRQKSYNNPIGIHLICKMERHIPKCLNSKLFCSFSMFLYQLLQIWTIPVSKIFSLIGNILVWW